MLALNHWANHHLRFYHKHPLGSFVTSSILLLTYNGSSYEYELYLVFTSLSYHRHSNQVVRILIFSCELRHIFYLRKSIYLRVFGTAAVFLHHASNLKLLERAFAVIMHETQKFGL